jgi:hypothetical protein
MQMARSSEPSNPFYVLLILTALAFVFTALGYVASLVALHPPRGSATVVPSPAMLFLDRRGEALMLWLAAALGVLAVLAMGLDRWRSIRAGHGAGSHTRREQP